jgi:hypothetical protein
MDQDNIDWERVIHDAEYRRQIMVSLKSSGADASAPASAWRAAPQPSREPSPRGSTL